MSQSIQKFALVLVCVAVFGCGKGKDDKGGGSKTVGTPSGTSPGGGSPVAYKAGTQDCTTAFMAEYKALRTEVISAITEQDVNDAKTTLQTFSGKYSGVNCTDPDGVQVDVNAEVDNLSSTLDGNLPRARKWDADVAKNKDDFQKHKDQVFDDFEAKKAEFEADFEAARDKNEAARNRNEADFQAFAKGNGAAFHAQRAQNEAAFNAAKNSSQSDFQKESAAMRDEFQKRADEMSKKFGKQSF